MREQAGVGDKGKNIRAKQARQAEKRSKYFSTRRELQQKCDLLQRKITWMFHRHQVSKVTIIKAINGVFPSVTGEIPYSKEIFLASSRPSASKQIEPTELPLLCLWIDSINENHSEMLLACQTRLGEGEGRTNHYIRSVTNVASRQQSEPPELKSQLQAFRAGDLFGIRSSLLLDEARKQFLLSLRGKTYGTATLVGIGVWEWEWLKKFHLALRMTNKAGSKR
ncbi:hypothetical protein KY284_010579 [Solanum tuberosum]|nr:hypothetical protein KY284_010579 [Solanum tuberosum]